jgi:ATP-binding cassette subfamily B protein
MISKSEEIPSHPKTIETINHLRFSNISLSINLHQVMLFEFHLRPSRRNYFVGPSGSGKTTLVKLVGLYKPRSAIFYNKNANEIDLTELRQQLGFVTQDAQLFSGTIKTIYYLLMLQTKKSTMYYKSACKIYC